MLAPQLKKYHEDARGSIAFFALQSERYWKEYPARCPEEFVKLVNWLIKRAKERGEHLYCTLTRFKGKRRRTAEIVCLTAVWVDLDLYRAANPVARNLSEKIQAGYPEAALEILQHVDIPAPTLVVSSGRGAYLIYLVRPATRPTAQPLFNAVAKALVAKLHDWGADARVSTDMKRVLRVPGSINWRSGQEVVAFVVGDTWDIHDLVRAMADYAEDAEEFWSWLNAKRKRRGGRPDIRPIRKTKLGPALLWRVRLEDLWKLLEIRWAYHPDEGWRDKSLFLLAVAHSWVLPVDKNVLDAEIRKIAKHIIPYGWQEFVRYMSTLLDRVEEIARNPALEFERDKGRYKFRAETISEWLQVTEEEALQLPHLSIPPVGVSVKEWKKEKVRQQLLELRRKTHGWEKAKTKEAVEERMAKILVALQEGPKSAKELADLLGVSVKSVKRYVARLREAGYNISAFNKPEKGQKGAGEWLYMYIPTVELL
jgi:biotin operon repressor